MIFIMLNQADHHELHGQLRRIRVRAHQVEAGQVMAVGLEQVGERHRASFETNHRDAKMLEVVIAEAAQ
ncbi:hypothetical protein D9M69_634930 [compost metagenome]